MGLASSHCGLHDVMMAGVRRNPLFMVKVRKLVQALRSHMEDPCGSAKVDIGVCCSRGRHRSVALEFMLRSILEVYRCNVLPTKYLEYDAGNWSHLCFSCHCCREGNPYKTLLRQQLHDVAESVLQRCVAAADES